MTLSKMETVANYFINNNHRNKLSLSINLSINPSKNTAYFRGHYLLEEQIYALKNAILDVFSFYMHSILHFWIHIKKKEYQINDTP